MASSPEPTIPKVLFLTGSPDPDALNWNQPSLTSSFLPAFSRFLRDDGLTTFNSNGTAPSSLQASLPLAKWRAISCSSDKERSNYQAARNSEPTRATQFLSFSDPAQQRGNEEEHMDFFEHSLAILQNLDSSQIELPDGTSDDATAFSSSSFATTSSTDLSDGSLATYSTEAPEQQVVSFSGPVKNLKDIPNARHLQAIHPQTITVNILAGIISVQPARTVKLRKRDGEMDIVEVLVGDDTRAGFTISFWLLPLDSQAQNSSTGKDTMRGHLSRLRAGDVVLVTHVALSEFNGNVYGQSLSRRITRNNTSVTVLSDNATGVPAPTMAKLRRVREWSDNFVGKKRAASPMEYFGADPKRRRTMELPPETQPGET